MLLQCTSSGWYNLYFSPMSDTRNLKAQAALLAANVIYGLNFVVTKSIVPAYIGAFALVTFRVWGAFLLFALIKLWIVPRQHIRPADRSLVLWCSIFGVCINQLLFIKGLSLTSPINAALLMISTPILVLILATLINKERLGWQKITGIAMGASGAILVVLNSSKNNGTQAGNMWGDLLIFINATSYSLYLVLVKPLMHRYHYLTLMLYIFAVSLLPVTLIGYSEAGAVEWGALPLKAYAALAFVIVFTTFFAYLLYIYALQSVSPSLAGMYIYAQPLVASLVAVALGVDALTWQHGIAAALIFSGVYLVNYKPR